MKRRQYSSSMWGAVVALAVAPVAGCHVGVMFGSEHVVEARPQPQGLPAGAPGVGPAGVYAAPQVAGGWPFGVMPARFDIASDDGHTLALWEKRPPMQARRAILLIHGRTWSSLPDFDLQVPGERRSLMEAFVDQGYATFALDLRGYGSSARDATGFITPDRAARDVMAALKFIAERDPALGPPVLFGWSMGAMVTQLVAQRAPDQIAALVLIGYPTDPDKPRPRKDDPAAPARTPNTAEAAAEDFITPGAISRAAIDVYVKTALATDPVRVDWRRQHEYEELDPAKVKVPTLLLQGERDPLARDDAHGRLFARLGTSDKAWRVLADSDHAALLEHTQDEVVAEVVTFVETGAPRRGR